MASVDVVINTIDKGSQQAVGFVKQFGQAFLELSTPINQALELFGKVRDVAGEVLEAFEEGATANQVASSFDNLNESLGVTPGLLERMREASRGTIDDTTLMAGSLTLVAGATDDMAKGLLENAPQLLEIAKAAQKLNPTLGDTAFLYESISTGIKRQSPLILDNLGIVISAGEAYENYAAKIGKSASELTKAEQGQAFLNATLEAGNNLIGQVGGNVDSATDAYQQLGTIIENTLSNIKGAIAEAVAPELENIKETVGEIGPAFEELAVAAVPALIEVAEGAVDAIEGLAGFLSVLLEVKSVYDELQGVTQGSPFGDVAADLQKLPSQQAFGLFSQALEGFGNADALLEFIEKSKTGFKDTGEQLKFMTDVFGEGDPYIDAVVQRMKELDAANQDVTISTEEVAEAIGRSSEENQKIYDVFQDVTQSADEYTTSLEAITRAQEKADAEAEAQKQAQEELNKLLEEAAEAYRELQAASGDYFTQAIANQQDEDFKFDLSSELQKQADAAGASAEALAILGTVTGEFTDEQAEAALKAAAVTEKIVQAGKDIAALDEITPGAIGGIVGEVRAFIRDIENEDFSAILNPEIEVQPKIKSDAQSQSEITTEMKKLFRVEDIQIGEPIEQDMSITASAEVSEALGPLGDLYTEFDELVGAFDSFEPPVIEIDTGDAITAIGEITQMLDDIPRTIEVVIAVTADVDPDAEGYTT